MTGILNHPIIYLAYQWLIGAMKSRRLTVLEHAVPQDGERVLDVGCGPGYVIEYLPRGTYVGFDIDQKYIRYAQKKYAGRGQFHCTELNADHAEHFGEFDLVLLNGVLHHLDDDSAVALLRLLANMLSPSGRVVTLDGVYLEHMSAVSRYLIDHDRGNFVRDEAGYRRLVADARLDGDFWLRGDMFHVPYDALVMRLRRGDR